MKKTQIKSFAYQAFCIFVGIVTIAPILYAISISFMQPQEILQKSLHLIPDSLYLGNYAKAISATTLSRFMWNSLVTAGVSSIIRIITCSLAAYAFAFFEFKGKKIIFTLYLATMMIPSDILIVQNYATVAKMNLVNTYLGMMIVFFVSAMNIFVLRQNFLSYSLSIKEASLVDGCTNFKFFYKILLPSSTPALVTVFISSFLGTWNTYLWPLIVTNRNEMRTVQVAVTMLNFPDDSPYGAIMAASILILIPSFLVFLLFQDKIKSGMMAGSVKG